MSKAQIFEPIQWRQPAGETGCVNYAMANLFTEDLFIEYINGDGKADIQDIIRMTEWANEILSKLDEFSIEIEPIEIFACPPIGIMGPEAFHDVMLYFDLFTGQKEIYYPAILSWHTGKDEYHAAAALIEMCADRKEFNIILIDSAEYDTPIELTNITLCKSRELVSIILFEDKSMQCDDIPNAVFTLQYTPQQLPHIFSTRDTWTA